jgi:hypothetical protein
MFDRRKKLYIIWNKYHINIYNFHSNNFAYNINLYLTKYMDFDLILIRSVGYHDYFLNLLF